jgi:surface antigen
MAMTWGIVRGTAVAAMAVAGASALGGCSTTGTGGASLASLSAPSVAPVAAVEAAPLPVPVNYGGFLGGAAGSKLPEADRKAALAAEDGAVASGERRSWKGAGGVYGFVVPGSTSSASTAIPADGAPAECRSFTSTIFFGGRPQTGKGTGCRDLDGNWHVTS